MSQSSTNYTEGLPFDIDPGRYAARCTCRPEDVESIHNGLCGLAIEAYAELPSTQREAARQLRGLKIRKAAAKLGISIERGELYVPLGLLVLLAREPQALMPMVPPSRDLDDQFTADVIVWHELERAGWRDYQIEAIKAAVFAPLGRGIVEVAPGGGKTRIGAGIIAAASALIQCKEPVLFPREGAWIMSVCGKDLLRDTKEAYLRLGETLAKHDLALPPIHFRQPHQPVPSHIDVDGKRYRVVGAIDDEVHRMQTPTRLARVLQYPRSCLLRIGLSGTALERGDGRDLLTIGAYGMPVYQVTQAQLAAAGHTAHGTVRFVLRK